MRRRNIHGICICGGTWWCSWLRHCTTSQNVAGSIPDGVIGIFHWQFFRPHYGPGVDSASNRNEYQEYFLGVKAASAYLWQPCHLHVPIVLNSGSLNVLELSGPVQACNGIALPLCVYVYEYVIWTNIYSRKWKYFKPSGIFFWAVENADNSRLLIFWMKLRVVYLVNKLYGWARLLIICGGQFVYFWCVTRLCSNKYLEVLGKYFV